MTTPLPHRAPPPPTPADEEVVDWAAPSESASEWRAPEEADLKDVFASLREDGGGDGGMTMGFGAPSTHTQSSGLASALGSPGGCDEFSPRAAPRPAKRRRRAAAAIPLSGELNAPPPPDVEEVDPFGDFSAADLSALDAIAAAHVASQPEKPRPAPRPGPRVAPSSSSRANVPPKPPLAKARPRVAVARPPPVVRPAAVADAFADDDLDAAMAEFDVDALVERVDRRLPRKQTF